MPAFAFSRQPDAIAWFGSAAGQALLAAEAQAVAEALRGNDAQPWLWLAVGPAAASAAPVPPAGRGVRLSHAGDGFEGPLRCALPLPLPSESIGRLVLQHAHDDGSEDLIDECARVLAPGGRLWLFSLNPWSPYRRHWRRAGLPPRATVAWRLRLGAAGLQVEPQARYFGPCARVLAADGPIAPLRAACLLQAEKRTPAAIPSHSAKSSWRAAGAAPA